MLRRHRRGASIRPTQGKWLRRLGPLLRIVGAFFALLGVAAGVYGAGRALLDPELFPLRHIRMHGERHNVGQADLHQVSAAYLGQSFFGLDIAGLRGMFALNPWIEQVSVRRLWPDTLEIRFRERTVFGHWGQHEMVDINGIRFQPVFFRELAFWPRLAGPDGRERHLIQTYRQANAIIAGLGLKITRLVQDKRRAWRMQFDNGLEIKLGRQQFTQRLMRFVAIYPDLLANRIADIATVDLRYINGFAVRWKTAPVDSAG